MTEKKAIDEEIRWRRDLLAELGGKVANYGIDPATLRDWGVYGGQQGIWVDKQRTGSLTGDGNGLAVGVLHKGNIYPDDFDETGVIYHYPVTNRPRSRDQSEISAVKNCNRFSVPLFVIAVAQADASKRDVYFGHVTMWDDRAKIFIIEFGLDQPSAQDTDAERPFELTIHEPRETYEAARRSGQAAFRIAVFRRYGAQCAVCDMAVIDLLDAAHLVPKSQNGSDDARNGIPLCVLHHRAFDKQLFCIDGEFLVATRPNGPTLSDLRITKRDINHLKAKPHKSAVSHRWEKWLRQVGA